jgi:RNA polymerase sigma factor (sigma-70 family)
MEQNAEQNLVKRAKQGEAAAMGELFRLYWRAARAAAYGVTGDFALAEDAASEAFYAAIESLPDLRDTQRFGPWLRTIVVRTARRQKAKAAKESGAELQTRPDGKSQPPGADLERQELVALIHEAVGRLSESLREAVVLFYFEGYSLKEAAGFLDVPEGTLKRRLHEGRQRLREAAERILKGTRAMNAKREQILQQLKDAVDEGIQSESFFQAMRQALRLRPVPHEMLRKAMQKHWAEKKKKLPFPPEKERMLREALGRIYGPSERAKDPNHPVGAASDAIRAALPEFEPWQIDLSQVDVSQVAQRLFDGKVGQAFSFMRPPGLTAKSEGSYITGSRAWLVQDQDGRLCTSYELIQRKASGKELKEQMHQGNKLSDTLFLWKEAEALELRDMEDLLRRLAGVIVPEIPVQFCPYEEPRYRAGLRMQLGDNPIPAAIGGVHNCWPGLPEGASFASILIYLESWAAAQSGQVIELMDFSPSDFFRSSGE